LAACGGSTGTELFDRPTATTLGAEPSNSGEGTPSSTATASAPKKDPTTPSEPTDAGTTKDAEPSTDPGKDAGEPPPPPPAAKVRCGDDACNAGSEYCCASYAGQGKAKLECQSTLLSVPLPLCNGVKLACDDQSDCPSGQVCCGTVDNGKVAGTSCRASCQGGARLCDPKAAVDECAASDMKCGSSNLLDGYGFCRD
jgi:hypothetical protein